MNSSETFAEYWLGDGQSTASTAYDSLMGVLLLVWAVGVALFVAYLLGALLRRSEGTRPGKQPRAVFSWAPRVGTLSVAVVILVYAFHSGVQGYLETVVPRADAIDIEVTATQWAWSVQYPSGAKPSEFVRMGDDASPSPIIPVPVGRPVRLLLTSDDSFHSISIPDLRFKMGVFPGRDAIGAFTATTLTPEDEAGHLVYCGDYCGQEHAQMLAFIKVVPEEEFDRWILSGGKPAAPLSPVKLGMKLYRQKGCFACHSVTDAPSVGPSWKGLYESERRFVDGTTAIANEAYLHESIFTAGAKVVEGYVNQMPPYTGMISDEEAGAIIEYIKSLKDVP